MSGPRPWQDLCAARKKKQHDSIPPEWLIQLPPNDQLNVMDVPSKCGLLSPRELEITETVDIDIILRKLSTAEWSSLEVTTAFLKRAVVAQQLARLRFLIISPFSLSVVDHRQTVLPKYLLNALLPGQKKRMTIYETMAKSLGHYMVCQYLSKISLPCKVSRQSWVSGFEMHCTHFLKSVKVMYHGLDASLRMIASWLKSYTIAVCFY